VNSRIVVVGSANTDLVVRLPRLPRTGETVAGGHFQILAGGKGANQAVAAARVGARVTFIANIGRDAFGDARITELRDECINTRHVARSRTTPGGVALILVAARGENLIAIARGSNDELRPAHLDNGRSAIRAAGCLVVQLEIPLPTVRKAMELARQYSVPVLLNPAPAVSVPASLLRQATFLTPNESELAALTGRSTGRKAEVEAAARGLHALGVKHVLATCGSRGVFWCSASGSRWFSAPKVNAVDTVGAGDCFSGVFAAAIAEGKTVAEAIEFAVKAAALSVTRPGAQSSMPTRREIERFSHCRLSSAEDLNSGGY
jgi:ribokinase